MYNWMAVDDGRHIAPADWHVATDEDWMTLEVFLGMSVDAVQATEERGTNEGSKMKETGASHWRSPNPDATNEVGFFALPGGWRISGGGFYALNSYAHFWTSTTYNGFSAWRRYLWYADTRVARTYNAVESGFSVRLVKD